MRPVRAHPWRTAVGPFLGPSSVAMRAKSRTNPCWEKGNGGSAPAGNRRNSTAKPSPYPVRLGGRHNRSMPPAPLSAITALLLWSAPLPGAIVRSFDAPSSAYSAGHRGVDLAARADEWVLAPVAGAVAFNGQVAGIPTVTIQIQPSPVYPSGGVMTFAPVASTLSVGSNVSAGAHLGQVRLLPGQPHYSHSLHWGLIIHQRYYNPAKSRIRLTSP